MLNPDVSFEVQPPARYSRVHVPLRVAIVLLLALLQTRLAWIFATLYVLLPILAALSIQKHGGAGYDTSSRQGMQRALHWWSAFLAFLFFVTDRFPAAREDLAGVRLDVGPGEPVLVRGALLRLVTSVPEFLVLLVLGWGAGALAGIAAVCVLVAESVPEPIRRFLTFYVSLQARFLAHHAALVSAHPLWDWRRWQPR
jgi:hypothetical protein